MSRYECGNSKSGVNTANTIMWQLRASSTERLHVLEIGLSCKVAPTTGPSWRLNRPTAVGTSSATVTPQPEDPDIAATTALLDTTWSANPTLAGTDLREFTTTAAIGSGIVWTWYDQPLVVPKSGGLCIVNGNASGATTGTLAIYVVFGA